MTPQQKAIVKKLGGVPKVKGSVAWKMYHEPKEVKKEALQTKMDIKKHMSVSHKELTEKEKTDYQRRTGRGYNE